MSDYGLDCFEQIAPPRVDDASLAIYEQYVNGPQQIETSKLSENDFSLIQNFVTKNQIEKGTVYD